MKLFSNSRYRCFQRVPHAWFRSAPSVESARAPAAAHASDWPGAVRRQCRGGASRLKGVAANCVDARLASRAPSLARMYRAPWAMSKKQRCKVCRGAYMRIARRRPRPGGYEVAVLSRARLPAERKLRPATPAPIPGPTHISCDCCGLECCDAQSGDSHGSISKTVYLAVSER